ncbi:phosphatidylethanolamine-binding protein [Mycena rebaudengoi]|nr:phosphatidylethanolamine-binding protein [Mycena rebaudengoi]
MLHLRLAVRRALRPALFSNGAASRSVATASTSSSSSSSSKLPPAAKPAPGKKPSAIGVNPRPPAAEFSTPKKPHMPKVLPHGRLSQKTRKAAPRKWTPPPPRRPRARTLNRARMERRTALRRAQNPAYAAARARVGRIRLGFHTLRHANPPLRGRGGRVAPWLRAKLVRKGQLRTRRNRTREGRPAISLRRPRRWNRPLLEGVLPAYDEALKVIRGDAVRVRREAAVQRGEVQRLHRVLSGKAREGEGGFAPEEKPVLEKTLEKMRERLNVLEVQSEVNLPEVRWSVANAMADMTIPSHRHLVEQRWRKDGDLDLLMERIHQMHVIPDVIPALHPSLDLHVTARLMPDRFDTLMRRNTFQRRVNTFKRVVPGRYLTPQQTRIPPKLYANVFHTDTRLYTMLLVDPDVPDQLNQTFTTFLHWMKPNIPLSATHTGRIPFLNTHTRYIPPHPQRGTPYHRYTLLLLPQPPLPGTQYTRNTEALLTAQQAALTQSLRDTAASALHHSDDDATKKLKSAFTSNRPTHPNAAFPSARAQLDGVVTLSQELAIPALPADPAARRGFDVRAFVKQWGLNGAHGGGVHMWREVWDKYVGAVYRYELHESQPVYGRPPRGGRREAYAAPTREKYHAGA